MPPKKNKVYVDKKYLEELEGAVAKINIHSDIDKTGEKTEGAFIGKSKKKKGSKSKDTVLEQSSDSDPWKPEQKKGSKSKDIVLDYSSDSDSSDDSHAVHGKKGKTKSRKSGRNRTRQCKVKYNIQWPHMHALPRATGGKITFDNMSYFELVEGELEIQCM